MVAIVAAVTVGACAKKQPPPEPVQTPPPTTPTPTQQRPSMPVEDPNAAAAAAAKRNTLQQVVNFDYDRSDITAQAATILQAKLPVLREDPSIRLRIEGHADERGSIEYNLALGMRRAQAVKNYLAGYQLEAGRFQTESFGEERPRVQGSNEAAWAQNRRAEFVIVAGSIINMDR